MFKLGLNPLYNAPKLFVIGDVSGMGDKLEVLLEKIIAHISNDYHIVFVGDLLDHGKEPFKVLDLIKDLKNKYPNQVFVVRGNHEIMMMEFLLRQIPNSRPYESWPKHGGRTSLDAFRERYCPESVENELEIIVDGLKRDGYWEIYENLIPYYESEKYLVSHAPLDPVVMRIFSGIDNVNIHDKVAVQSKLEGIMEKMGREIYWKFSQEKRFFIDLGKQLVCGHQFQHGSKPRIFKDRIFLDSGVGYKEGRELFAVELPSKKIISSKPD